MKTSAFLSAALVAGAALAACSTVQTVTFDQLQAADYSFPESVRSVGVVDNAPVVEAAARRGAVSPELEGDGRAAAEALAVRIADADYFDRVIVCDSALRAADDTLRANVLLSPGEVDRLAADLGVDLLLSLDRVHVRTRAATCFFPDLALFADGLEATVTPVVRVYLPGRGKPLLVITPCDTLTWLLDPLLSDSLVVADASRAAAVRPARILLPHWEEVTRLYYDGGSVEMRDAGVCLRENDWDGAGALWQAAYDKRKGRQKMRAAFNLALYSEMKDDPARAREWLLRARELVEPSSRDGQFAALYDQELAVREERLSRLRTQMSRFEDKSGE